METSVLIRKILMDCPVCGRTHEVEERKRGASLLIKNEEVFYEERYYFCEYADEEESEFAPGGMVNENLLNARNAYRQKMGLLTSDEIVEIRRCYDLSQVDLARLLGWGEATIARYESRAIQDKSYDMMLRLIRDNPLQALEFLKKNADKFSKEKYHAIREQMTARLGTYGKEYLSRQALEGEYVKFDTPSEMNGYTLLDINKLEAVISCLATRVKYLYKVKLMKLLWYVDALAYQTYGKAVTGLVYRHETMGALPIGHYQLMNLDWVNVQEEIGYHDSIAVMMHVYPAEEIDMSVLTDQEQNVLDRVIAQFCDYRATDMVAYMHQEKAYTQTSAGQIIPFRLAGEIRPFASSKA